MSAWRRSATSASVSVRSGDAERDGEREAHAARADRVGAEDVEELDPTRAGRRPCSRSVSSTAPAGHGVVDDEREVDRGRREPRHGGVGARHRARAASSVVDVELEADGRRRAGRARRRTSGIDLADAADVLAVDDDRGGADRMEARCGRRYEPPVGEPQLLGDRLDHGDGVVRCDVAIRFVRGAPHPSGAHRGQVHPLFRQGVAGLGRREDGTQLEQRDVGHCRARRCAQPQRSSPGRSCGPQERLLGAQRVLDLDHRVGREPGPREVGRREQRQRVCLVESGADEHVGQRFCAPAARR